MSMFASPADYWRARAERAEAGLVAAANGAIAALSLPGAPTRSEREEIIASLRAAIAPHDGREQWGAWFANTTDDELRAIFAARPDLAARLAAVLDAAAPKGREAQPNQGGEAVIYYAANVEHGGDFNHIPISMFDQPAIFLSKEKAEQFCSFANGTGSRHEARSLTLKSIALPAAATGLAEADCIAIYDAVTRSNLTRDVKTDERKVAVVRGAE